MGSPGSPGAGRSCSGSARAIPIASGGDHRSAIWVCAPAQCHCAPHSRLPTAQGLGIVPSASSICAFCEGNRDVALDWDVDACSTVGRVCPGCGRCYGADAEEGRHPQFRRRRQPAELRLPRGDDVRGRAPRGPALFAAAQDRRGELSQRRGRPRRELDGERRRARLHVQAAQGRQVPRRLAADLGGRQGDLRAHHPPAGRRHLGAQVLLRGLRGYRDARRHDRRSSR